MILHFRAISYMTAQITGSILEYPGQGSYLFAGHHSNQTQWYFSYQFLSHKTFMPINHVIYGLSGNLQLVLSVKKLTSGQLSLMQVVLSQPLLKKYTTLGLWFKREHAWCVGLGECLGMLMSWKFPALDQFLWTVRKVNPACLTVYVYDIETAMKLSSLCSNC